MSKPIPFKNELIINLPDQDAEILFLLTKASRNKEDTEESIARDFLISRLSGTILPFAVETMQRAWEEGLYDE